MRTIQEIEADIDQVQHDITNVQGTTTEVYARIVGYYRSVRNWNRGKREEYNHRKLFVTENDSINEHLLSGAVNTIDIEKQTVTSDKESSGEISRYELFVRKTCPNCPPVKDCCSRMPFSGTLIDVDTAEGFEKAQQYGIFSAPTVIFFDEANREVSRAHSTREIHTQIAIPEMAETLA